jgi:hypothetical protein
MDEGVVGDAAGASAASGGDAGVEDAGAGAVREGDAGGGVVAACPPAAPAYGLGGVPGRVTAAPSVAVTSPDARSIAAVAADGWSGDADVASPPGTVP